MIRRINQSFGKLYGQPCWNVRNGHGSFLTLEFGEPRLEIREPHISDSESRNVREWACRRSVNVVGKWHLWIYSCDWKVVVDGKAKADSSTVRKMERAPRILDGQILKELGTKDRGKSWDFTFDLGATLHTTPYDRRSEQWTLYEPGNKVLSVRADKKYSYGSGDRTPKKERWLSIDA